MSDHLTRALAVGLAAVDRVLKLPKPPKPTSETIHQYLELTDGDLAAQVSADRMLPALMPRHWIGNEQHNRPMTDEEVARGC